MDVSASTLKFPTYDEFCSTSRQQSFSLPDSLIYYITKHPTSPEMYQKMIKCCKYFFIKNPIIVLHCLNLFKNGTEWKTCTDKSHRSKDCFKSFPLNQISRSKVWITFKILVCSSTSTAASNLIPKLFQRDACFVHLSQQIISFNDFMFLSKNVEMLKIDKTIVTAEEDGSKVPVEKIVASLSKLRSIVCVFSPDTMDHSSNIFEKLLQVPHFKNIKLFVFRGVTVNFDFDVFYDYFESNRRLEAFIAYRDELPDDLKNKLESIINEYLMLHKQRLTCFKPAIIHFPGQNENTKKALSTMWKYFS